METKPLTDQEKFDECRKVMRGERLIGDEGDHCSDSCEGCPYNLDLELWRELLDGGKVY